jgi:hypothetical protein
MVGNDEYLAFDEDYAAGQYKSPSSVYHSGSITSPLSGGGGVGGVHVNIGSNYHPSMSLLGPPAPNITPYRRPSNLSAVESVRQMEAARAYAAAEDASYFAHAAAPVQGLGSSLPGEAPLSITWDDIPEAMQPQAIRAAVPQGDSKTDYTPQKQSARQTVPHFYPNASRLSTQEFVTNM